MFLVLVKTDAAGVKHCLPRFASVEPLTVEQLEQGATTDVQQAQFFSATPMSMASQTVLRLEPTPPPGLEDWQAFYVSLWLL